MKTVKWHEGVSSMVSKRDARKPITVLAGQGFSARKSNFSLIAKRAGLK